MLYVKILYIEHRRSWHGITTHTFILELFTYLFSIEILYYFISSP